MSEKSPTEIELLNALAAATHVRGTAPLLAHLAEQTYTLLPCDHVSIDLLSRRGKITYSAAYPANTAHPENPTAGYLLQVNIGASDTAPIGQLSVSRISNGRTSTNPFDPHHRMILSRWATMVSGLLAGARHLSELERRIEDRTTRLTDTLGRLEATWLEAMNANRIRTTMLTRITNDLRNPLTIILNTLSLLQEEAMGPVTQEQKAWLVQANESANQILALSDDLFALTQIELQGLTLQLETVPLRKILGQAFQVAQSLSWPDSVAFQLDVDDDLPELTVDAGRILQVLINLITFAFERTEKGQVVLHASYNATDDTVEVGVADTGHALGDVTLTSLFNLLAPEEMETATPVAMMGLAISHQLIELHGGRMWGETAVGGGLNVIFTLPNR